MAQEQFNVIDRRLVVLERDLAEYRTQQETNTASLATLQSLTSELLDIARLHQQALRLSQQRAEENSEEIRRIWEYLLGQQQNSDGRGEPEDNP